MTREQSDRRRFIRPGTYALLLLAVAAVLVVRWPGMGAPAPRITRFMVEAPARKAGRPAATPSRAKTAPSAPGSTETVSAAIEPRLRSVDRFPTAETLQTLESRGDDPEEHRRVRVVKSDFNSPFLRLEEALVADPTGAVVVVRQVAMVADHIIVGLRPGQTRKDLELRVQALGCSILRRCADPSMFLVSLPSHDLSAVPAAVDSFRLGVAEVAYAEPDFIMHAFDIPNDPQFSDQWGLHNTGQLLSPPANVAGTAGAHIHAVEAWDKHHGNPEVLVAVIDGGVDYDHEDLDTHIWYNLQEWPNDGIDDDQNGYVDDERGWNFNGNNKNVKDDNPNGHGTSVAGIIGARGNNGKGICGVCWEVAILPLKVLDSTGNGRSSDVASAIRYAADKHCMTANCSLGSYGISPADLQSQINQVQYAFSKGMLVVCAAGNEMFDIDVTPPYPAALTENNIISVMATDENDVMAGFSNWGRQGVDLAAPGRLILSTVPNDLYRFRDGTSFSAPFVTGACALIKSMFPDIGMLEIKQRILDTVDKLPSLAGKCVTGGRLNLVGSLHDPDPIPQSFISFTSANYTVNEDGIYATIGVTRSGLPVGDVSVQFSTGGGSALAGSDYQPVSQFLQWPNGVGGTLNVNIFILDDAEYETPETVNLVLSNLQGFASFGSPSSALLTINDDDSAPKAGSSNPANLINIGSTITPTYNQVFLFTATTAANGTELWRTDSTESGTVLLKDINPGKLSSSPTELTTIGSLVVFAANDGVHGTELWVTDGTAAGTMMVKDIVPGAGGSSPAKFSGQIVVNNAWAVLFTALTPEGEELWRTDGTAAGTVLVKDIQPGAGSSSPSPVVTIYPTSGGPGIGLFTADDGVNGRELWRTDGTTAGTVLLKDILAGGSSNPTELANVTFDGSVQRLLFSATSTQGTELWKSDGTAAGTVLVKDIRAGTGSSAPKGFSLLYTGSSYVALFSAAGAGTGRELWKTDGTAAGTVLVKDINPGTAASSPANFFPTYNNGYYALFAANGGSGIELWRTDGTAAGTTQVMDINPGTAASKPANFFGFGSIYFSATDGVNGIELWRTDGTAAGTYLFKDLNPGTKNSTPSDFRFTLVNDVEMTLFVATDAAHGRELRRTDGTVAGTVLLKEIR